MPVLTLPSGTDLVAPRETLAYLDRQTLPLPRDMAPVEVWNLIRAEPLPFIGLAFRLRDAIASRFGVRRIGGFSRTPATTPVVGDKLDFFRVERSDPQAMTLTDRDRHLDVMIFVTTTNRELAITASVVTHNLFGRLYMLPVAPAHGWIVKRMLRNLARTLA